MQLIDDYRITAFDSVHCIYAILRLYTARHSDLFAKKVANFYTSSPMYMYIAIHHLRRKCV